MPVPLCIYPYEAVVDYGSIQPGRSMRVTGDNTPAKTDPQHMQMCRRGDSLSAQLL